jgi:hypothetical protein
MKGELSSWFSGEPIALPSQNTVSPFLGHAHGRSCKRPALPCGVEAPAGANASVLPRKEVIQAHLPVHLPCYDFVPVTSPTLDGSFLAVRIPASGVTSSHDVTGGVYKARERIHRSIADLRLLATPSSCRRVAACNLN